MNKDEFVEKMTKGQDNAIGVEFNEDEVDVIYDVTDPDTGEYDPLLVIDTANIANELKIHDKLLSLNFYEDGISRYARLCLKKDIMDSDFVL